MGKTIRLASRLTRRTAPTLAGLAGLASLTLAGFMFAAPLGFVVLGLSLLVLGWATDQDEVT